MRPDFPDSIPEQKTTHLNSILSPERRTRSYDCNLDQLKLDDVEPLTPTKKRNGIFGSFEKGIDQVRLMLTPGKKNRKGPSGKTNQKRNLEKNHRSVFRSTSVTHH